MITHSSELFLHKLVYFIDLNNYLFQNKYISVYLPITIDLEDLAGFEFQKKRMIILIL